MQRKNSREVIRLDLVGNPGHVDMLDRVYDEIYLPAFPIADEPQTLEYMKSRLMLSAAAPREYVCIAAGHNLNDPHNAQVDAMSIGIYYKEAQAGLMAYNAIRPEAQGQGLGRLMVDERRKAFAKVASRLGHDDIGIFLEVNDPAKMPAGDDVMDPNVRLNMFKRWGGIEVPIDYVQPPLDPQSGKYDGLILMAYQDMKGRYPSPSKALGFLREMFITCGKIPPEADPDFAKMRKQLLSLQFNASATNSAEVYRTPHAVATITHQPQAAYH